MPARVLRCTGPCHQWVQVYEACQDARTETEHQWLEPASYVCGECLEAAGSVQRFDQEASVERNKVKSAVTGGEGSSTVGVD